MDLIIDFHSSRPIINDVLLTEAMCAESPKFGRREVSKKHDTLSEQAYFSKTVSFESEAYTAVDPNKILGYQGFNKCEVSCNNGLNLINTPKMKAITSFSSVSEKTSRARVIRDISATVKPLQHKRPMSKKFICNHARCTHAFTDRYDLARHAKIHTNEKTLVCRFESCGKIFRNRFDLKTHVRIHIK